MTSMVNDSIPGPFTFLQLLKHNSTISQMISTAQEFYYHIMDNQVSGAGRLVSAIHGGLGASIYFHIGLDRNRSL